METINDSRFIDLGLPVKWATCNIGANQPHEKGWLYAWGETRFKPLYMESNYKFGKEDNYGMFNYTKYKPKESLMLNDDVAFKMMGKDAHIPSTREWDDLFYNCHREYKWIGGRKGILFTSLIKGYEGNSIFIPFAGTIENGSIKREGENTIGLYWTNSISFSFMEYAKAVDLSQICKSLELPIENKYRWFGLPVRAVKTKVFRW